MDKVPFSAFVIDEKPYCLWDAENKHINLDTIKRIDPKYFSAMAEIFKPLLESDQKQYVSIALRTFYSHALETLFALICATIQAPHCVVGWLLKYQNRDLFSLVRKIHSVEPILTIPQLKIERPKNWNNIAKVIFSPIKTDEVEKNKIIESFGELWSHFAFDFLNQLASEEYNSIKHGLRLHMSGFYFAMGIQKHKGEIVPSDRMNLVSQSDFGSSFFTIEKMKKANNIIVHHKSINWHPDNFINALILISISIQNILCFLQIANREEAISFEYLVPSEIEFYKSPWANSAGCMQSIGINSRINTDVVEPLSDEEIMEFYKE